MNKFNYRNIAMTIQNVRDLLSELPDDSPDKAGLELIITGGGNGVKDAPDRFMTPTVCRVAIACGGSLYWIPQPNRVYDLCLTAVMLDGTNIIHVPEEHRTRHLCLVAVSQDGWRIVDVPKNVIDQKMCLVAVKNIGYALARVPDEFQTYETCLAAVTQTRDAIIYVPENMQKKIREVLMF